MSEYKPVIGITLGDFNGIGPEVTLKALSNNKILKMCTLVIYGSVKVLTKYRKLMNMEEWTLYPAKDVSQVSPKRTNVINCWPDHLEIQPGNITPEAGQCAFVALKSAVADLQAQTIDAIVTAPINKHNIQSEEFTFAGHTEYFTHTFNAPESVMLLVSDLLRVAVVTGHIPLQAVQAAITKEKVLAKMQVLLQTLKKDFGIQKPRLAVLGLNPHAGEEGLLGNEEQQLITPAIQELKNKGALVYGPFPADGFFGTMQFKRYDAVLAMYHDQGLIPFKTLAFESGVNYTAGLPIVRTSPDHGTAYNIAGKNQASEVSMREAIYLACDIVNRRKEAVVMK